MHNCSCQISCTVIDFWRTLMSSDGSGTGTGNWTASPRSIVVFSIGNYFTSPNFFELLRSLQLIGVERIAARKGSPRCDPGLIPRSTVVVCDSAKWFPAWTPGFSQGTVASTHINEFLLLTSAPTKDISISCRTCLSTLQI